MASSILGTQMFLKARALSWRPRWLDEKEMESKIKERCQYRLCAHMPRSIVCPKTIPGEANNALVLVWFQAEREMQNSNEGDQGWADNLSKKDFDQYCKQQWLNIFGQQSWYLASDFDQRCQTGVLCLTIGRLYQVIVSAGTISNIHFGAHDNVLWYHLKYIHILASMMMFFAVSLSPMG